MIQYILDEINAWWTTHFVLTSITKVDESDSPEPTVEGVAPRSDEDENSQPPAVQVEPFGLAFVAPLGQRAIALLRRSRGAVWPMGSRRYRPQGMKEGETCLYCTKAGTTVWLKADGTLRIDAASNQDVVVNGGTAKVARQGDRVELIDRIHLGALAVWMAQVESAINGLVTGAVAPLSDTFLADPGLTIKDGADHFKA